MCSEIIASSPKQKISNHRPPSMEIILYKLYYLL